MRVKTVEGETSLEGHRFGFKAARQWLARVPSPAHVFHVTEKWRDKFVLSEREVKGKASALKMTHFAWICSLLCLPPTPTSISGLFIW